jgi:hypothetical protein
VKLRCVCSFRKHAPNVMVGDHMWLDHVDAQKIVTLTDGRMAMEDGRPKRGTKLFLTAKVIFYAEGKAKIAGLERVELVEFTEPGKQMPYFDDKAGIKGMSARPGQPRRAKTSPRGRPEG